MFLQVNKDFYPINQAKSLEKKRKISNFSHWFDVLCPSVYVSVRLIIRLKKNSKKKYTFQFEASGKLAGKFDKVS